MNPISVSTLNRQIKSVLETTFLSVYVEAEISNLTHHTSGHIYFTLKDESSSIKAVMFKGNAKELKFKLEVGQKVIVSANISLYEPRGEYQLLCSKIEPSGVGSLALAYEQLKTKLKAKGYFEAVHKKTLPKFPKRIAIITSQTGAAIEDMKKVATKRWSLVQITLLNTIVQGSQSAQSIAQNIARADKMGFDVIVVGRGGGSIEDLWGFNEEVVADAIFAASTPIVSAVGHESDFLISDLVADVRASTPSNAMEIVLPSSDDVRLMLDDWLHKLIMVQRSRLTRLDEGLRFMHKQFHNNSVLQKIEQKQQETKSIKHYFDSAMRNIVAKNQQNIVFLQSQFATNNPELKAKIGFAQVVREGKQIALESVTVDDVITFQTPKISAQAKILSIQKV